MKKILPLLLAAAFLTTPVLAAGEPASPADPAGCAHNFVLSVLREATCAEKGLLAYTCSQCGLTYTAETPPDGEHDYVLTETTATCTQDGEAVYTCTRCGDVYTEAVTAAGHVPEDTPAACTHSQRCAVCGEVLVPAAGHNYVYQYDAERDEAGNFTAFGTWKCAVCGRTLAATEGNALYYYSLPEAEAAMSSSASATDLEQPDARADDASGTDTAGTPGGDSSSAVTDDAAAADPQNGLWIAVSAAALAAIVLEAVILVRSLRRKKVER